MMKMDSKRIASGFIVALAVVVMLLVPNKYIIGTGNKFPIIAIG